MRESFEHERYYAIETTCTVTYLIFWYYHCTFYEEITQWPFL